MKTQETRRIEIMQIKLKTLACVGVVLLYLSVLSGTAAPTNIVVKPASQIGAVFGSAVFSVTAQDTLPLSYQWQFNGQAITNATNSALILGPLGYAETGSYSVVVSDATGKTSSSNALLSVSEAIASTNSYNTNFQSFLLQFTNLMSAMASSATIYVVQSNKTAVAFSPPGGSPISPPSNFLSNVMALSISDYAYDLALKSNGTVTGWDFNTTSGTNIPSGLANVTAVAASESYGYALRSDGTVVGWPLTSASNVAFQLLLSNATAITPTLTNNLALNANGTVFQWQALQKPALALVAGLSNVIALAADEGSLALKADGTVVGWGGLPSNPLPGVSNVVAIAVGGLDYLALETDGTVVGSSTPATQFPVALSNVFFVNVNFMLGGGVALFNDGSPVFTVQPANQTPTNGGTIWLHARAVGAQPMSYQWLLDGTNIAGATNADLTITNAQGYDTGQYSALASNQVGSATSLVATVTIPVSHTPANLGIPTILPGGNLLFSVYSTNGSLLALNNTETLLFQASGDLVNWMTLTNGLTLTNGGALLNDPNATNSPVRFYRLLRE